MGVGVHEDSTNSWRGNATGEQDQEAGDKAVSRRTRQRTEAVERGALAPRSRVQISAPRLKDFQNEVLFSLMENSQLLIPLVENETNKNSRIQTRLTEKS